MQNQDPTQDNKNYKWRFFYYNLKISGNIKRKIWKMSF